MDKKKSSSLSSKLRAAEKELTKEFIKWRCKKTGHQLPDDETLDKGSEQIVAEAHNVVKKGGKSFLDELKKTKDEFVKAYKGDEEE